MAIEVALHVPLAQSSSRLGVWKLDDVLTPTSGLPDSGPRLGTAAHTRIPGVCRVSASW
jgi:hypothetical protein